MVFIPEITVSKFFFPHCITTEHVKLQGAITSHAFSIYIGTGRGFLHKYTAMHSVQTEPQSTVVSCLLADMKEVIFTSSPQTQSLSYNLTVGLLPLSLRSAVQVAYLRVFLRGCLTFRRVSSSEVLI